MRPLYIKSSSISMHSSQNEGIHRHLGASTHTWTMSTPSSSSWMTSGHQPRICLFSNKDNVGQLFSSWCKPQVAGVFAGLGIRDSLRAIDPIFVDWHSGQIRRDFKRKKQSPALMSAPRICIIYALKLHWILQSTLTKYLHKCLWKSQRTCKVNHGCSDISVEAIHFPISKTLTCKQMVKWNGLKRLMTILSLHSNGLWWIHRGDGLCLPKNLSLRTSSLSHTCRVRSQGILTSAGSISKAFFCEKTSLSSWRIYLKGKTKRQLKLPSPERDLKEEEDVSNFLLIFQFVWILQDSIPCFNWLKGILLIVLGYSRSSEDE